MTQSSRRIRRALPGVLAALAVALAASGALAGGGGSAEAAPRDGSPPAPAALSETVQALASNVASQWASHEEPTGALVDPVSGLENGDYGDAMTGQAMVVAGLADDDQSLIASGLAAELADVEHPDRGGFELLAASEAYAADEQLLAGNPAWIAARPQIVRFLRRHRKSISDVGACYTSPHCYDNLKLVSAVADFSLLQTGLHSTVKGALLANRGALRTQAFALLAQAAENAGSDAYRVGGQQLSGIGILSDPSQNPLAYHALSTLMLGKTVLLLGSAAPSATRAAFARTAKALVALLAPDGNGTYIGRGQAQVWTVGVTIDALAIAAQLASDPTWRGRYLAAAALSLERLETLYPTSGWGLPLVPRFADVDPVSYAGIDQYANTVEYDGLTLWALDDAVTALAQVQPAPAETLPSDGDGVFIDPSHTRFAAVTHGNLWFAIHALDSNLGDARYGFGLLAAELDGPTGWQPVLPAAPLTRRPQIGTLALQGATGPLYPVGRRISASASGTVSVTGGWTNGNGKKLVDQRTVWTYAPTAAGDGVTLSFGVASGARYEMQVWYEAGAELTRTARGLSVTEPDGTTQTYTLNAPFRLHHGAHASSAYAASLQSAVLVATPTSADLLYTTTFSAPSSSPAGGASGPTGASASSGASGASSASGASGVSGTSGTSGASGSSGPTGSS